MRIELLYVKKGIVPLFSPEWQFKDEVKAKKIDKESIVYNFT